jgi:hypothetical protein
MYWDRWFLWLSCTYGGSWKCYNECIGNTTTDKSATTIVTLSATYFSDGAKYNEITFQQQEHEPQDFKGGRRDPQNEEVEEQVQKKLYKE